ncbi:hypothetical protein GQ44DRAFT_436344 [Phaeosphaeriaceae sp. PMI808]|nr:hypothetical protein GQ44DRAFT_436344 [Phaeosphaeriaceae sp. PMI808]
MTIPSHYLPQCFSIRNARAACDTCHHRLDIDLNDQHQASHGGRLLLHANGLVQSPPSHSMWILVHYAHKYARCTTTPPHHHHTERAHYGDEGTVDKQTVQRLVPLHPQHPQHSPLSGTGRGFNAWLVSQLNPYPVLYYTLLGVADPALRGAMKQSSPHRAGAYRIQ